MTTIPPVSMPTTTPMANAASTSASAAPAANAATTQPATGVASQAGSVAAKTIGADFNMFLKLLTTQMQNQDPLSPMDTSQYTQQLVQYSQVEQSIQQTSTLKDILARLSTQDMAQASGFIGHQATFDSNLSGLSGTSSSNWSFEAARPVASMTANVFDSAGNIVSSQAIDAAQRGTFTWNGILPSGARASDGPYSLSISATDRSGETVPVTVRGMGIVTSVTNGSDGLSVVANGVTLPVSKMRGIAQK